jgi:hypothetical protein
MSSLARCPEARISSSASGRSAAIDRQRDAGDEPGVGRGQIDDRGGDLVGRSDPLHRIEVLRLLQLGHHAGAVEGDAGPDHVSVDRARTDAIDPHVRRQLQRHRARQVHHRPLGRAIGGHARRADQPGLRGDIDDRAARRLQRRQCGAAAEVDSFGVHVHHRIPQRLVAVGDGGDGEDAGIVHQDIEAAERAESGLDDRLAAGHGRDVAGRRGEPIAGAKAVDRRGDGARRASVDGDPRARREQGAGRCQADTPRGSGHQRPLALQIHGYGTAWPRSSPVQTSRSTATPPFTITYGMPVGNWQGSS